MIIKKRLFSVLMAIAMVFSILPTFVFAETGDVFTAEITSEYMPKPVMVSYKVLTEDASGGTVAVVSVPTDTTGLILPNIVTNNGKIYTVTEIGDSAFEGCSSLYDIGLPSSLTKIGSRAFKGCRSLMFPAIYPTITDIGDNAFDGCSSINSILSANKNPAKLGKDVFANCSPILRISIPYGTKQTYIDKGWPEDCLGEISLFEGKILDTYSNPISGATVSVYDDDGKLKGSVKTDESGYFDATAGLEYDVEYMAKIEKSGYMTMDMNFIPECTLVVKPYYNISLAKVSNGFRADTIEGASITYQILTKDEKNKTGTVRVVYGPGSLYSGSVTLPNIVIYNGITYTVTEIGDYSFDHHRKTTSVSFPSGLVNIGSSAFVKCGIQYIISNNQIPAKIQDNIFTGSLYAKTYIPAGTKQAYIDAGWDARYLQEIIFYSISGKVVDENGNGIADVMLTISNDDGYSESMYTDSDGNYNFANCIGKKSYTIKAKKDGYKESVANIDLDESDVTDFDIVMAFVSNVPGDGNLPDSPTPTPSTPTPNKPSVPTNNPVTPTNNANGANNAQTTINNTPQTGDNSGTIIYIAFGCMLMAILAAGCLVVAKKKS